MSKLAKSYVFLFLLTLSFSAQEKDMPGWDLSYSSLLKQNKVAQTEWIWKWLEDYDSPAGNWITTWQGKPIISSILVEYPAFHAAERTTMWFVRTDVGADYWELVQDSKPRRNEEDFKPEVYDALFKQVTSWKQLEPKPPSETPKDVLPGYIGFLSSYNKDGSRQMLLTMEDFVNCVDKGCMPGKLKPGRLMAAIEPILLPEESYKHKSEAEIALMTPEQRIDEEIKEGDHILEHSDNHMPLIQKYRRMDGLKGFQHIIRLIDGYDPKRRRDTRYYVAVMIAANVDDRIVRLRSSPDGLQVIEAIKRLVTRMLEAGEESMTESILESLKGANSADEAIRDTLWVKYRIKMSDNELLEFSNYMVKQDPAYPRWSESNLIKDYSRKNEWGNPFQVYIMKKPTRYYHLYRAFKGARPSR